MTDQLTDLKKFGENGFRFQNQKCLLTYSGKVDKVRYIEWFVDLHGFQMKFIRLAHEHYKDGGDHTHVLVDYGKVFNKRNAEEWFDYEELHPNIKLITSKLHWDRCVKYLGKEDPENADLLVTKKKWIDKVNECNTVQDALALCEVPAHVPGTLMAFRCKPIVRVIKEHELKHWQSVIWFELDSEPDDRHVNWIVDRKGGGGKTWLCRYYRFKNINDVLLVNAMGGMRDFSTIVRNAISTGWNGRVLLINLSRSDEDKAIYAPIEASKDGIFTATKYDGMSFDIPQDTHVYVFANWCPDVDKLSLDRWNIRSLEDETLQPLTLEGCRRLREVMMLS